MEWVGGLGLLSEGLGESGEPCGKRAEGEELVLRQVGGQGDFDVGKWLSRGDFEF